MSDISLGGLARLNYDVSYPISHRYLDVRLCNVISTRSNVTNVCKHLRFSQKLQCNGGKVKETEGLK